MSIQGLPAPLQQVLPQIVTATFGSRTRIQAVQLFDSQRDYGVVRVRLDPPALEVVIKLAAPDAGRSAVFERSAALHHRVAQQTTVPIAPVLALDTACHTVPWAYVVKRYIPGVEWAALCDTLDERQRVRAFRQLGQALAELHSLRFPAFGELDATSAASSYEAALWARVQRMVPSATRQAYFLTVLTEHTALFSSVVEPRLCHDDLHHYNILFHQQDGVWNLATILDFDKAWAGHAASDLARMEGWIHMMHPALRAAYHAVHPRDPLHDQWRPLYQLLWCLEYPSTTAEHRADTQRVCQALGIAPPPEVSG